jgi:Sel1 repeat-containing protein
MRRIPNFRLINPISNRASRPAFRSAMTRAIVVMACCLAGLTDLRPALADPASDRAMATRYEQSAQAGDDDAQFYLGALHSAGVGRQRSDQEAFRWFSRATDQGHAHSMLIVAGLYASGRGVTKDSVKAYSWAYIVASASKVDEDRNGARQLMSLLMKRMTSDEIGRAVVAARTWRAVRTGGASKSPYIERAGDADQPTQAAAPPPPPPAPAVVQQPAPAAVAAPAVVQPAPSTVTTTTAAPRATPTAPAVKNAKRDEARDLIDQVPPNLRKRFGF